jgi:hypothetical protein
MAQDARSAPRRPFLPVTVKNGRRAGRMLYPAAVWNRRGDERAGVPYIDSTAVLDGLTANR